MGKKLLLVALSLFTNLLCAQETSGIPTIDELNGDFIVMNSRSYNGVKSLAEMKGFKITKVDDNLVNMSGFYMNKCEDFNAEYDAATGTISIPAGTPIFDMETYMLYLYPWNDDTEEVIYRPIEYEYNGHDSWVCNTTIMLMAINGEEIKPYYFSESSKIARCNATTENISYVGAAGSQDEYVEGRASYVVLDGSKIDIYNLLQADQYGYGVHIGGTFDTASGEAWFKYTTTGMANDGSYRILTGCEYDEETNMPTGMSYPESQKVGMVKASVDMEEGKISFGPMAIWAANYDQQTGNLTVDENLLYEFVKTVNVTFDVDKAIGADIENVGQESREISRIDYYTIEGMKIDMPEAGMFIIKKTYYNDNSSTCEKMIF